MKKRLFAIMLALAMVLAAVPALAEEGELSEVPETPQKTICSNCKEVTSVDEKELCENCAANVRPQSEQNPTEENKNIQEPAVKENKDVQGSTVTDDPNQNQQSDNIKKVAKQNNVLDNSAQPDNEHVCKLSYIFDNSYPNHTCAHKVTCEIESCTKYPKSEAKSEDCRFDTKGWSISNPNYDDKDTVKPTCEQGGKGAVKCSKCKHISYMETAKLGHDLEKINESQATCTEPAHGTYWKCKRCGDLFSNDNGTERIAEIPTTTDKPMGHDYEYHWGTWDCKTKTITAYRKCKRERCNVVENPTTISFSEKDRDTWYSCGKKYTTVYYNVVAKYGNETVKYGGKAECTYSTSDYCRPDWYYDPCYYNNPCGHWGCGNVCTRYSDCVPCRDYRTTFRVGGYNCLATPKTGDVSVIGMALISLAGAGAAIMGKKRK